MQELIPLVLGALAGASVTGVRSWRTRALALVPVALVVGIAVAWATGEIEESPFLAVWDCAQFLFAAGMTIAAVGLVLRRRSE
ncbi:MAG: hypothetical protein QOJ57_1452 [Thermoleophilaceae bacterium]|jgi:hypothetical protein|nr:hypothetical protein [Thermoleophilaceae bacterium]